MEYYKEIKLGKKPYDLSEMKWCNRVVYMPNKGTILFAKTDVTAKKKYASVGEVLTQAQALARHPDVFCNNGEPAKVPMTYSIVLTDEQRAFVESKGKLSRYIRDLIDREMEKEASDDKE